MSGRRGDRSAWAVPAVAVAALLVAALALVPALRDERRLTAARTAATPLVALDDAVAAESPATLGRARAIEVLALVRLRRMADAEAVARAEARRRPEDASAARRLYEVQRLRGRSAAAARTLARLRTLDPLYASGLGG